MMKTTTGLCVLVCFFSSYVFSAENFKNEAIPAPPMKNFYIALGAGATFPMKNSSVVDNTEINIYGPTTLGPESFFELNDVSWDNHYQNGYEANVALGYRFNPFWAAEVEFVYQNMDREIDGQYTWVESEFPSHAPAYQALNNPVASAESAVNLYTLFNNIIFSYKNSTAWTPFVGAGVGVAFLNSAGTYKNGLLEIDIGSPPLSETAPTKERSPAITGTAFGWQFKTGVAYDVSETISLILQYRLLGTTQFNASSSTIITNPDTSTGDFYIPAHQVAGVVVNGVDLNVRFNV